MEVGDPRPPTRERSGAANPAIIARAARSFPRAIPSVIDCKPSECRWRRTALAGDDPEPIRRQVAEAPPILPVVDEYRRHRLTGLRCDLAAGGCRLGKRPIRQLGFDLLGLTIFIGMIARLERQAAAGLEAPVEELRQKVRNAAAAHLDETSWRQGRETMWLWRAATCRQREIDVREDLAGCCQARLEGQPAPSTRPAATHAQAA